MEDKKHIVAVTAFIKDKDKILVVKRRNDEIAFPGKWTVPGGKVERGQTILEALKREVYEEVGLEIENWKKYLEDFTFVRPDGHNVVGASFLVKAKSFNVVLDQRDFEEFKWVGVEELDSLDLIQGIKKEAKLALKEDKRVGAGFGVMLLKEGRVLLGKRHDVAEKADSDLHGEGTWTMPGGKLHFGESFEDGAYREVLEETGIKVDKENLRLISFTNDRVHDAHFVTAGFLCYHFDGEPQVMEPDEITEWQWFSFEKLPAKIFFCSEKVMKNYLDREVYKH
mgnify:FL=1